MAVKTRYFKEHEYSSMAPWWSSSALGSQPAAVCGEPLKPSSSIEKSASSGDRFTAVKPPHRHTTDLPLNHKGNNTIQFTVFPAGEHKISSDGEKPLQTTFSLQAAMPYRANIDLGIGQPLIYANYSHEDRCYGLFPTYGSQIPGRIMLPMNMTTNDGPMFVNPKQYHGIIRRRKSRAKAELNNTTIKKRKPYMHLSRHLHAMRRPRGTGGRFLNSGSAKAGTDEAKEEANYSVQLSHPTGSQSSEVLRSDSGTLNSSKETNGGGEPNISGSEVTSMYSRRDVDHFSINHLNPPGYSFSVIMDNRHSIVMPSKWVATADSCCNLKV